MIGQAQKNGSQRKRNTTETDMTDILLVTFITACFVLCFIPMCDFIF